MKKILILVVGIIHCSIAIYAQTTLTKCQQQNKLVAQYNLPSENSLTTGWSKYDIYSDEFSSTNLDLTKWEARIGKHDAVPKGYFRRENVSVSGGYLRLRCKKESYNGYDYTAARVDSKHNGSFGRARYGYYETRVKFPYQTGINPCFWLWGSNGKPWDDMDYRYDEIDVFELYHDERNYFLQNFYHNINDDDNYNYGQTKISVKTFEPYATFCDKWVIWSVEWLPKEVNFYINRELTATLKYTTNEDYVEPLGNENAGQYTCTDIDDAIAQRLVVWFGANKYIDKYVSGNLEKNMYVDYIRSYKLQEGYNTQYWPNTFSLSDTELFKVHQSVKLGGDASHTAIVPDYQNVTIWAKDEIVLDKGFEVSGESQFTARVIDVEDGSEIFE